MDGGFDQWMKKYRLRSTLILMISIVQMIWVTWWSTKFVAVSQFDALGTAGVIAAVQVPVTMLFTSVYRIYSETKIP